MNKNEDGMYVFDSVVYFEMDYHDFEKIVAEQYDVTDWSYAADTEAANDSNNTYDDMKKKPLDKYDQARLDKFISTNGNTDYVSYTLMQDLVNRGVLPEGNYLVRISW